MNILIVAACEFASNTAIHPLNVAKFMQERGIESIVSFRSDDNNVRPQGPWKFRICDHRETAHNGVLFPDGRGPDLVHAWTPREHVRRLTELMLDRYGCPYIVHLEDNEEVILADTLGNIDYRQMAELPARIVEKVISPYLSHPKRFRWFLEGAAGLTALIDKLIEFKPAGIPGVVFWPGFDEEILNAGVNREHFGLNEREAILVYNGNIHLSNEAEVSSLIDAVGLLRQRGVQVTLLKTGANHAAIGKLKKAQEMGFLVDLGFVTRPEIRSLLNIADVLVQPGHASPFNDYRFPCKLPEFLATGKPVVLPDSNLGRFMRDGADCLLMQTGEPEEIADKVQLLLHDRQLAARIGMAGRVFAEKRLRWERNLEPVLALYRQLVSSPARVRPPNHPDPLPVAIDRVPAENAFQRVHKHEDTYLASAVRAVATGSTHVLQRPDGDAALYQKWIAATVERALGLRLPSICVEDWLEQDAWLEATNRGYAAGLGNYLRQTGLPISDLAIEQALQPEPEKTPWPPKTSNWITDEQLRRIIELYAGSYKLPQISYATVRDYCDSVDHMRCLATLHGDLKNVQRPWAVKAMLGMIPRGGRLLEIGAGEPWIADVLSRAGYEVWVVDPYEGSGNGPVDLAQFMSECPEVRFLRDTFSDELMDIPPVSFDCVYSVSVLEHIDDAGLRAVGRGIARFLKPDGLSIHAIDHVQRGTGYKEDMQRLELLASLFGVDDVELRATLQRLDRDLDVYTLSAEGFNQWRGSRPYDQFRMRKWVSIQFATASRDVTRTPEAAGRP